MKALPWILVVVFAVGGVAAFMRSQSLESELLAAQREAQMQQQKAEQLGEELRNAQAAKALLTTESETLRQRLAGHTPSDAATAAPTGEAPAKEAQSEKKKEGGFGEMISKMWSDPEMKKMMRQQQAMALRMMYGDLIKELGLSEQEADNFYEALSERTMAQQEAGMAMMNGRKDDGSLMEQGKKMTSIEEKHGAKLREMLGNDGYAAFQKYEKSVGERMMMQQFEQQFSASGAPLEPEQRQQLLQAMTEERLKTPATAYDPTSKDVAGQLTALKSDDALHAYMSSQADFNARVAERAKGFLSPEQATAFTKIQQQITQMQEMGIKMSRTMFKEEAK